MLGTLRGAVLRLRMVGVVEQASSTSMRIGGDGYAELRGLSGPLAMTGWR